MFRFFINILFSFFILIFFSPLITIICIISIISQGRPIFFIDERLGKNGKSFNLIKFRTMDKGLSINHKEDNKRITKWGSFLRKTSLDELPSIINILKREMNLVGPRPMPVKYFKRFNDYQKKRLNVKPGITGLAQIKGRNNISWRKRFRLDVLYINKRSNILDFVIMLKTILIVLNQKGVYTSKSEVMEEFFGQ